MNNESTIVEYANGKPSEHSNKQMQERGSATALNALQAEIY